MEHKIASSDIPASKWLSQLREFQLDDIFATNILARAYEYVARVEVDHQTPELIKATVAGNYTTYVASNGKTIIGECSCLYEGPCKHLAALIVQQLAD